AFLLALCACTAPPARDVITVTPTTLDFGTVIGGTFNTLSFAARNDSDHPVVLDALISGSPAFSTDFVPYRLLPGEQLPVEVQFIPPVPALAQQHASTLVLAWGDQHASVEVSGTATFVDCNAVRPVDFGGVLIGDTAELPMTVV